MDLVGVFVCEWVFELCDFSDDVVQTPWEMSAEQQTEVNCIIGADYFVLVLDFAEAHAAAVDRLNAIRVIPGFDKIARQLHNRHTSRCTKIGAAAS